METSCVLLLRNPKRAHLFQEVVLGTMILEFVHGAPQEWFRWTGAKGGSVATASITTTPEVADTGSGGSGEVLVAATIEVSIHSPPAQSAADAVPVQAVPEGATLDQATMISDDDTRTGKDWYRPIELGSVASIATDKQGLVEFDEWLAAEPKGTESVRRGSQEAGPPV
ncbi:hypothetical protein V6N12_045286 [Hibiscus sabdariffa]|uniref:Uncharacterized protein n=1 Tax=Hibiscus sabdariffa TaxID=183260 RepID=A0ABR2G3E4_9ROSI